MIKNYLTIALRRFRRGGAYAILNVIGLAVGMATCSLILLLVHHEWSFDRFHDQADHIYRVYLSYDTPAGDPEVQAMMAPDFTPALEQEFTPIQAATRLVASPRDFALGDEIYRLAMAEIDPGFFLMFTHTALAGDPVQAITDPGQAVLTESGARVLFGSGLPDWGSVLGRVVTTGTDQATYDFSVGAIIADFPNTSSVDFELAVSFENYDNIYLGGNNWGGRTSTYVLLEPGYPAQRLEAAFKPFTDIQFAGYVDAMQGAERMAEGTDSYRLKLQPLTEVHSDVDVWVPYEAAQHRPMFSWILLGIGGLILLIACINFMTLSVGQSTMRAREVGVRKVLGANRGQIMKQHWGESFLAASLALVLGFAVAMALLPAFNGLVGRDIRIGEVPPTLILALLAGLIVLVGVVAGGYPAAVLSKFSPARVLKGSVATPRSSLLTQSLVVIQFTISIGLVAATAIMSNQLAYLLEKDLGFDEEYVIAVNAGQVPRPDAERVLTQLKDRLKAYDQITHVERAGYTFTRGSDRNGWQDANGNNRSSYNFGVGYDYLALMGMEMVQGRFFSEEYPGDATGSIVVNEALVREFGIDEPIGYRMTGWLSGIYEEAPTVIGVVKDFNFQSLHTEVEPAIMNMHPDYYNFMGAILVKVRPGNVSESLALIEAAWGESLPGKPFTYSFVDDDLATQYATEQQWQRVVTYSSLLAILIACMGLFGLALLTVGRRTKEIGIRKALGASAPGITALLSREFAFLVLIASLIATPLTWWSMSGWLEGFAFRVAITPWVFLGAALLALTIALSTVALHAVRAARSNPIHALRYE